MQLNRREMIFKILTGELLINRTRQQTCQWRTIDPAHSNLERALKANPKKILANARKNQNVPATLVKLEDSMPIAIPDQSDKSD